MQNLEDALIEPVAVQEVFVDGFTSFEVKDAILTCVGYRTHRGVSIATIRIVMPLANLADAIAQATAAATLVPVDAAHLPASLRKLMS